MTVSLSPAQALRQSHRNERGEYASYVAREADGFFPPIAPTWIPEDDPDKWFTDLCRDLQRAGEDRFVVSIDADGVFACDPPHLESVLVDGGRDVADKLRQVGQVRFSGERGLRYGDWIIDEDIEVTAEDLSRYLAAHPIAGQEPLDPALDIGVPQWEPNPWWPNVADMNPDRELVAGSWSCLAADLEQTAPGVSVDRKGHMVQLDMWRNQMVPDHLRSAEGTYLLDRTIARYVPIGIHPDNTDVPYSVRHPRLVGDGIGEVGSCEPANYAQYLALEAVQFAGDDEIYDRQESLAWLLKVRGFRETDEHCFSTESNPAMTYEHMPAGVETWTTAEGLNTTRRRFHVLPPELNELMPESVRSANHQYGELGFDVAVVMFSTDQDERGAAAARLALSGRGAADRYTGVPRVPRELLRHADITPYPTTLNQADVAEYQFAIDKMCGGPVR